MRAPLKLGAKVLEWTDRECQRRAQLVGDVREEPCLRAVELLEPLGLHLELPLVGAELPCAVVDEAAEFLGTQAEEPDTPCDGGSHEKGRCEHRGNPERRRLPHLGCKPQLERCTLLVPDAVVVAGSY